MKAETFTMHFLALPPAQMIFFSILFCFILPGYVHSQVHRKAQLSESDALEKLVAIDDNFRQVRSKCVALICGEISNDDPAKLPTNTRFDLIYANDAKAGLNRHDFGLGGDFANLSAQADWFWNRNLKLRGQTVRLQGTLNGGVEGGAKSPTFFQVFDPLCVVSTTLGDMLSGSVGEDWFANKIVDADIRDAYLLSDGNAEINLITSKKRAVGCTLILAKKFAYQPIRCEYFLNSAEDVSREYKNGDSICRSVISWKNIDKCSVPETVCLSQYTKQTKARTEYNLTYEWFLNKDKAAFLFDEDKMRSKWDSVESVYFELAE